MSLSRVEMTELSQLRVELLENSRIEGWDPRKGSLRYAVYPWLIVSVKLGSERIRTIQLQQLTFSSHYYFSRGNGANTHPNLKTDTRLAGVVIYFTLRYFV